MARRVFFSFHYSRDIWRANVVRNSWVCHPHAQDAGFWDASLWERTKLSGREAVKRLIDRGLENTSVTAVLIGGETASRYYVQYEIEKSYERGNGLLGIRIDSIKDWYGRTDFRGKNPFETLWLEDKGRTTQLTRLYRTYDWVAENGFRNFCDWVEQAAP